ncbi:hypothetical protein GGI12_004911 [Dipsacomyces acuminosporus]|nr:hypothetical protein GGI12_004911 [Dipsacomyces acuminosporus]
MGYSHYAPPQAPYAQQQPAQYAYGQHYYQQPQQPQVVYVQQQPQHNHPRLRGGGGCLPCLAGLGLGCCIVLPQSPKMDIQSLFSVKDKVVVVTGGGSGIGLMISTGFVKNGAKVYIVSRKAEVLNKVAQELNSVGPGTCIPLPCNLQDFDHVSKLSQKLAELEPQGISVLINNSGANWAEDSIAKYPDNAWTKVLGLNLQRVFTLTQQVLPLLEKKAKSEDPARIINIGSIDGLRVSDLLTPAYSASKAGVHHLTKVLAAQLGEKHITVNALAPGPFQSHMMAYTLKTKYQEIVKGCPIGRIGRPEDMAAICILLSSNGGSYLNGTVIPVDGGILVANREYNHANL